MEEYKIAYMPSDFSIHSDLLVHWTGRDIDNEYQPQWFQEDQAAISEDAVAAYLRRLQDILTYGLWMTEQPGWTAPNGIEVPATPCVCFTELKLSQSRIHAKKYGRLGIAVKRPFVFDRDGRPIVYYEPRFGADVLLEQTARALADKRLLHFFKRMNEGSTGRLEYSFYSESEWRIVAGAGDRARQEAIDPRVSDDLRIIEYYERIPYERQRRLKYLLPLDGWHAAIVYPALAVKNLAQREGSEIQSLIRNIARRGHAYEVEHGNLPLQLDLDLCKHL